MTDSTDIALAMPTHESGDVLAETLQHAARVEQASPLAVDQFIIVDDESTDDTREIARSHAEEFDWDLTMINRSCSLPQARQIAIDRVTTDWFLFLDDDVRLSEDSLARQAEWIDCERVGAVQGRKVSRTEPPADWVRRRSRRGGTHATLIRTDAVADAVFPQDLHMLEDEFLRQHVEGEGYRWVFDPEARFTHDSQERHPIGWQEGYLGGKYGLSAFHDVALNIPFAVVTGRNPLPHAKRAAGWVAGRVLADGTAPPTTGTQDQEVTTNADGA